MVEEEPSREAPGGSVSDEQWSLPMGYSGLFSVIGLQASGGANGFGKVAGKSSRLFLPVSPLWRMVDRARWRDLLYYVMISP